MKNSEQLQNRIIANRHVTKTCHSEGTQCLCNFCGKRINLPCHSEHPPGAWESSWLNQLLGKAYSIKYIRSAGSPRRSLGLFATQSPSFHSAKSSILLAFHRTFREDSTPSLRSVGFAKIRFAPRDDMHLLVCHETVGWAYLPNKERWWQHANC